MKLIPVPVVMEVVDGVMSVAVIHLTCTTTRLLRLRPRCLDPFSMTMPNTLCVVERKAVPAIYLVAVEMLLRDKKIYQVNHVSQINEVGFEPGPKVDEVLTSDIISGENARKILESLERLPNQESTKLAYL